SRCAALLAFGLFGFFTMLAGLPLTVSHRCELIGTHAIRRGDHERSERGKGGGGGRGFGYRGKGSRRRIVGWGGGAIGALMLVPAPWREAFGEAKPYKIGAINPLSGAAAAGGKTALVGVQMAVD